MAFIKLHSGSRIIYINAERIFTLHRQNEETCVRIGDETFTGTLLVDETPETIIRLAREAEKK